MADPRSGQRPHRDKTYLTAHFRLCLPERSTTVPRSPLTSSTGMCAKAEEGEEDMTEGLEQFEPEMPEDRSALIEDDDDATATEDDGLDAGE